MRARISSAYCVGGVVGADTSLSLHRLPGYLACYSQTCSLDVLALWVSGSLDWLWASGDDVAASSGSRVSFWVPGMPFTQKLVFLDGFQV